MSKQVRGAVLDLICHPLPKKLLVLLPVHMQNPELTASQCQHILGRFLEADDFRVLILAGTGNLPQLDVDAQSVRGRLLELGCELGSDGAER